MIAADDDRCRPKRERGNEETVVGRVEGGRRRGGGGKCDGIRESGEEGSEPSGWGSLREIHGGDDGERRTRHRRYLAVNHF